MKIQLLAFGVIVFFSCNSIDTKTQKKEVIGEPIEKTYLKYTALRQFVTECKGVEQGENYPIPFDSLDFDKVIAYDFDGREERSSGVINKKTGAYAPVILRQKELNLKQVNFLIDFLTDTSTYGHQTAACFEPHLGIVFYKGQRKVFEVDICLDCNYLTSTLKIPATGHKKTDFGNGRIRDEIGFSKKGILNIVEFSKELNLDYGLFKIEN